MSGYITYDTKPGGIPAKLQKPNLLSGSDKGAADDDDITSDNTPDIYGNNQVASDATGALITATKGGDTATATDTTVSSGDYLVTLPELSDGIWSITAVQTNASGTSPASDPLQVTIDTADPTITTFSAASTSFSGVNSLSLIHI